MVSRRAISWIVIAECQFIPRLHYNVLGTARLIFWYGCRCFPARHGKFRQCKRRRLGTRAEIDRGLRSQRKPIKMKTREIKKSVLDNNSRWLCVIPDLFLTQHVTAIKFREKSLKNEMLHESIFSVQRIS